MRPIAGVLAAVLLLASIYFAVQYSRIQLSENGEPVERSRQILRHGLELVTYDIPRSEDVELRLEEGGRVVRSWQNRKSLGASLHTKISSKTTKLNYFIRLDDGSTDVFYQFGGKWNFLQTRNTHRPTF